MSDKLPALNNLAIPALTDLMYIVTPGIDPLGSFNISFAQLRAAILAGVPDTIEVNTTPTGNVGGGLDPLHSFSLLAGSLANDDDYLEVEYAGSFATNDNDKRIVVSFGGQTITTIGTGLFDIDAGNWRYEITYTRLTSTTVLASLNLAWGFLLRDGGGTAGGNGLTAAAVAELTVPDLDANATTMLVQAEGTANDDIIQRLSKIKLVLN